jgi:hypothetical protein
MPGDELVHLATRNEGRRLDSHVGEKFLSWMRLLTQQYSLSGGFLMTAIGVIYLTFEKKLLAKSRLAGDSTAPADNVLSRSLVGVQVRNALTRAKLHLT